MRDGFIPFSACLASLVVMIPLVRLSSISDGVIRVRETVKVIYGMSGKD